MFPSSRRRSVYPQALRKRVRLFEFILPYMARHQPSRRFGTEALRPLVTVSAGLAVTPILPVAVPVGGSPCRLVFFKTEINVALFDIYESILSEIRTFVRMPSIPYHRLNAPAGDLVAGRRCVVSSVNAHVCGQMLQTLFHIVEDIRHGLDIVDDGRSDAHVDDDVVLAVHRTVLTVVEAVRLPFPVPVVRFRGRSCFAGRWPWAARRHPSSQKASCPTPHGPLRWLHPARPDTPSGCARSRRLISYACWLSPLHASSRHTISPRLPAPSRWPGAESR